MSNKLELKVGRTYRAKKPRGTGTMLQPLVNDRTIIWIGMGELQYDGPAVKNGAHYPKISWDKFKAWADRDVTDELPDGEYAEWPIAKREAS